eukprot:5821_1
MSASCFFWVIVHMVDFITDIMLAIKLITTHLDNDNGIFLGGILGVLSTIGLCLGLYHVQNQSKLDARKQSNDGRTNVSSNKRTCFTCKMCKMLVEDIPSMIICGIAITFIREDCSKNNWLGINVGTQIIITSTVSAVILVFTFCKECKGCVGFLFVVIIVVLIGAVYTLTALNRFGCA